MAVLYEKKHDIIKIKCTDRESRYKNIYREMREELKRVIGRTGYRSVDCMQRECEKKYADQSDRTNCISDNYC